jgi:hypothetical protein|tara:strand:+ start:599 stop:943 length:345 start_codon:yes stop_codon:yes gene_type:complete
MIIKNEDHGRTGTHLEGYIECSYEDLVGAFGNPTFEGGIETKIEVEWNLTFIESTRTDDNHEIVTVYNWKNGKRYCGEEEGLDPQDIKEWNIGGKRRYAVDLVHDAIKNYKDKK